MCFDSTNTGCGQLCNTTRSVCRVNSPEPTSWLTAAGDHTVVTMSDAVRKALHAGLAQCDRWCEPLMEMPGVEPEAIYQALDVARSDLDVLIQQQPLDDETLESVEFAAEQILSLVHYAVAHPQATATPKDVELLTEVLREIVEECEMLWRRRFRPLGDGRFSLRWRMTDKLVISEALEEFVGRLGAKDDSLERLFPPAYGDDVERNEGWAALVHPELIELRQANIETLERLLDLRTASREELDVAMRTTNDLRLMLASDAGIDSEDMEPPDRHDARFDPYIRYHHLSALLELMVEALDGAEPSPSK